MDTVYRVLLLAGLCNLGDWHAVVARKWDGVSAGQRLAVRIVAVRHKA